MKIVQFQRKPFPGSYSLESHFAAVREELARQGVTAQHAELPFFSKGISNRIQNMRWARRQQGDLNHIAGDVHYLAPALSSRSTILTICDLTILDYYSGLKRALLKQFWYSWPVRHAAAITVISEATRQQLLEHCPHLPAEKVEVIPVSVSPAFQPVTKVFNEECPRVLQIGTKKQKNIERLVAALQGMPCELHIIGPLSEVHRRLLGDARIKYLNEVNVSDDRIRESYQQCDVVSFVSTAEGFGMPVVEAQCVERPVVTSNCSSMPEVAGQGACLVDPYSVDAIREGFRRIIEDSAFRSNLVKAGIENRGRFTLSNVANKYANLYRRVLTGNAE